jgi:hypothetical protein
MAERRFPRPDGNFAARANHYHDAVKAFYDKQGLDPTLLTPLQKALETWNAQYPAHVKAQAAAEGARQAKDAARAALEKEVRPVTNFVQGYPRTTNADRAEMGITVRDTSPSPAPAPSSRPLALVESGQRLTHQLRLVDESTLTSGRNGRARRARPAGVLGTEVWVKLVEAGTGHQASGTGAEVGVPSSPVPSAQSPMPWPGFSFLTMTTRPSFRAEFKAGEGGKTAVYMARWINTRGEKRPWSEITTATVAA